MPFAFDYPFGKEASENDDGLTVCLFAMFLRVGDI